MERIQASIGRLILFSFIITLVVIALINGTSAISSDRHKHILAVKSIPTPTAVPLPTDTPTPTSLPTATTTSISTPAPTADPTSETIWDRLAACESHQNWSDDTGNGYYGGLQFSQGAWESVGGTGKPSDASRDEQIMRGKMLQAGRGWAPWGDCSRTLGLY